MPLRINLAQFVLASFLILLFFQSMAAYNLVVVPVPWIAQVGIIALFFWMLSRFSIYLFPGMHLFVVLFFWALVITLFNSIAVDYASMMGRGTTTSYGLYVSLRFMTLLTFMSAVGITYWVQMRGLGDEFVNALVKLGTLVSILALYIYVAQIYGLPELPRNRLGTGGGVAVTEYSYAFKRAGGTFREPSHLAQWLVLPFLLSYFHQSKKFFKWSSLIMGLTILLTGSLTGIVGVALAIVCSFFFIGKLGSKAYKPAIKMLAPLLGAVVLFGVVSSLKSSGGSVDLFSVLWERIAPIIYDEGVYSTNRSYIYEYLDEQSIPFWGKGLGNANILFGRYSGLEVNIAFLNLFLNFIFSLGIFGFALLVWIVAYPLYLIFQNRKNPGQQGFVFVISAYLAWIFMFVMHAEELSIHFGIVYGLIVYMVKHRDNKDMEEVSI